MSVVDVYNRDVGVAHAVSEEKFAAFIVAKGHTFPFNQLANWPRRRATTFMPNGLS